MSETGLSEQALAIVAPNLVAPNIEASTPLCQRIHRENIGRPAITMAWHPCGTSPWPGFNFSHRMWRINAAFHVFIIGEAAGSF